MAPRETEAVPAGWLGDWFGPVSPRRKLWLFVSTTGTVGLVLALILLLNQHKPKQEPEPVRIPAVTTTKPKPKPQPDPFENEPEPKPVVVTKPEPPAEDKFDLNVILLPAPDEENQGEQFQVTSEDAPADGTTQFDPLVAANWRQASPDMESDRSPWESIERLVPLGPLEPQEVASAAIPTGSIQAHFETTQPRKSAPFVPMAYDLVVMNSGPTPIDRLVITQTLPKSAQPETVAPTHGVSNRTLRWEFERLAAQRSWRIPMTIIPTASGPLVPETKLEAASMVSSRTQILVPRIAMTLKTEPFSPLNKYQRVTFRITNNGDVPLNKLLMQVRLSDNLWHRFGNDFEFHELALAVGQTREALLHVRTDGPGAAELIAQLVTEEGATIESRCQFLIDGGAGETSVPPIATKPEPEPTFDRPAAEPKSPETEPAPARVIVPERKPLPAQPATERLPIQPEPAKANEFPSLPNESPARPTETPIEKQPTVEEKPANSKPVPPAEKLPVKEFPILKKPGSEDDPFGIPPKKSEGNFFD